MRYFEILLFELSTVFWEGQEQLKMFGKQMLGGGRGGRLNCEVV